MQSGLPSVSILTFKPSDLTFCTCMGHDHSSPWIKGQGQRSRLGLMIGSQLETQMVAGSRTVSVVQFTLVQLL